MKTRGKARPDLTPEELKENDRILSELLGWVVGMVEEEIERRVEAIDYACRETEGYSLLPCTECGREEGCLVRIECITAINTGRGLKNFVGKNGHEQITKKERNKRSNIGHRWGTLPPNRRTVVHRDNKKTSLLHKGKER